MLAALRVPVLAVLNLLIGGLLLTGATQAHPAPLADPGQPPGPPVQGTPTPSPTCCAPSATPPYLCPPWGLRANYPAFSAYHAAVVLGDQAYVFGGFDGSNVLAAADYYDPANDSWNSLPSL